jgi:2-oxoglutarate dehydrogenase E2 component (dihydrolipoamide succinyltransferase)
MTIEIKAPSFPESIAEGTVATWYKQPGEAVQRDELIVDIETDKVVLEVVAPTNGTIAKVLKGEGDIVLSNEVIAEFATGDAAVAKAEVAPTPTEKLVEAEAKEEVEAVGECFASPAARKLIEENALDASAISATGKGGRVTKEDVINHMKGQQAPAPVAAPVASPVSSSAPTPAAAINTTLTGDRPEKRVAMTRLRTTIAKRLVEAQQNAAMLTTYNEVNMQPIMELRSRYKEDFAKQHDGVKLGFMSFFVKAATEALKRFPGVNASIDGNDIVYHGYQDVGVAVSTERGLVVPVLRNAENMGLAEIESSINNYGKKAREGKLAIEDMTGGTFTISNGGVFGSMMSTPILNPPQTAILGMHKIQDRPMAVDGQVVILPMMYLAVSYDHRMIDGREAVQFLVTIKDLLEDPARILLQV